MADKKTPTMDVLERFHALYNNEAVLKDRLYTALQSVEEFRNLSMDRQGEVVVHIERMIVCQQARDRVDHEDNILKVDEYDYENDKVGC